MSNSYENGKIYKIVCNTTGEVYIGSTKAYMSERMARHRSDKGYDCASKQIIDRGNYTVSIIESYPCKTHDELLWRERYYIESMECINTNRPIITEEEHRQLKHESYERNKEQHLAACKMRAALPENRAKQKEKRDIPENKQKQAEYTKQWRADNAEKIKKDKAKYNEDNKEAIAKQRKEYRAKNAEAIKAKKAADYQKLKEKGIATITCGCGGTYKDMGGAKNRHLATGKHIKWAEAQTKN